MLLVHFLLKHGPNLFKSITKEKMMFTATLNVFTCQFCTKMFCIIFLSVNLFLKIILLLLLYKQYYPLWYKFI